MRWQPLALALTLTAAAHGQNRPAPAPPPYDPSPWMVSLRPWARSALAPSARIAAAHQLPLYDLAITLDASGRSFTLGEELTFTNTERAAMPELVLRVYANAARPQGGAQGRTTVVNPPVRFTSGNCPADGCTVRQESPSVIVVRPRTPLRPGATLRVSLSLQGTLPEIDASRTNVLAQGMESLSMLGAGEGGGDYGLLSVGDGIVSMANFYPVLARREGGRWERAESSHVGDIGSDDLANVRAVIDAPAGYAVATTGVTLTSMASGERRRTEVAAVGVRDFCAMMGATLQVATRRVGEVEVRSFFLPADRASGERVLDVAAAALEDFERRFGPYPYVDLDVVEAPLVGGAGGVEFPGLVTVASMFYRAPTGGGLTGGLMGMLGMGQVTESLNQMLPAMLEFVTAHEVAHQYWHGLVGSDSRRHPFVDESLAQWSAALYLEDRYGAERARRDADLNVKMNYQFMRMLGHDDGAVDRPASSFGSPIRYAGIVYGKGPYLYNALRAAAGDEVFFRALRRYVDTWRFRTAPPTAFVDALAAESPQNAQRYRALARRWLQEAHGDEDLGEADLGSLLGGMMGGNASPEVSEALRMLGPMLGGLGGRAQQRNGGGSGGGPQRMPQGAPQLDAQSVEQMQRAVQELMQQLGEAQ